MSTWRDNINLNSCIWFENEENKRNATSAIIAGLLFTIGWWLMIDANVVYPDYVSGGYYVCGIIGTVSLIMVNLVSQSQLHDQSDQGYFGLSAAKLWLFVGYVLGFASIIASFWICFADTFKRQNKMPGIELLLQNILVFVSSVIYKFGRIEENSSW